MPAELQVTYTQTVCPASEDSAFRLESAFDLLFEQLLQNTSDQDKQLNP